MRFKDISSRFQVFFKKSYTGKFYKIDRKTIIQESLFRYNFRPKVYKKTRGLMLVYNFCKYPLLVAWTSATKCSSPQRLVISLMINYNIFRANTMNRCKFESIKSNLSTQHVYPLHKKWSFPLRHSSVNVTKPAENCEFGNIYWRNP